MNDKKTIIAQEIAQTRKNIKRLVKAMEILKKARTDLVVRGKMTIEDVDEKLCRGQILLNRLNAKLIRLCQEEVFKVE